MREGWTYKKLGEIATFISGSRPSGGVRAITHGVLSLGGEHIGRNGHIDLSTPKYVSEQYYQDNPKGHLRSGDILLCKDGALSGKVALERNEFQNTPAMVNEHVFIIRTDSLYQPCLFFYLFSPIGQSELKSRITGAAQGGINGTNLKTIVIPVPPLAEQKQIVAELDLLSSVIEKKKDQLNEYDKLAQSIFYSMFGDPDINEMGWEERKLGEITLKITDGVHLKPHYTETGIPFISVVNINKGILDFDGCKYVSDADSKKFNKRIYPEKGDVLYTKVGATYGIPAKVDTDRFFCLYVSVCLIKPLHEQVNTDFLTFIMGLPFVKNQADKRIRGIGVPDLHLNQIASFKIVLPPLSLQQEFAEKIEAIERQKKLIKQSIAETETLFNSRMDYYFN